VRSHHGGDGHDFRNLLDGLRAGSESSVRELVDRYGMYIVKAVRRRLRRVLRTRFDSQDFVQAVWASFFAHRSQIADFDTPDEMIAFLATVASNKVRDEYRRNLTSQKRDLNREHSLASHTPSAGPAPSHDPVDPAPSPSELAIAAEQLSQMTSGQPSHYQRMVQLRADGATLEEIAQELGVSERNVRRVLQRLSKRLS
jgi:RNA polymerase sigma factor (sigma-70 family)